MVIITFRPSWNVEWELVFICKRDKTTAPDWNNKDINIVCFEQPDENVLFPEGYMPVLFWEKTELVILYYAIGLCNRNKPISLHSFLLPYMCGIVFGEHMYNQTHIWNAWNESIVLSFRLLLKTALQFLWSPPQQWSTSNMILGTISGSHDYLEASCFTVAVNSCSER